MSTRRFLSRRPAEPDNDDSARHGPPRIDGAVAILAVITALPRTLESVERRLSELATIVHRMDSRLPAKVLRVREAAEALGCSVPTVRRKIKSGELPSLRVGRSVRVDLSKVRPSDAEDVADAVDRALSGRRKL